LIDHDIRRAMAEWAVPGLAVGIVHNGETVLARGYGVRLNNARYPVTPDTIFGLLSPTKSFTATAIALLVDEGKLSWDDPVVYYVPEFVPSDEPARRSVTIRDIISHRSGYEDDYRLWYRRGLAPDRLLEQVAKLKRTAPVGSGHQYNNTAYSVAATIIERTTGQTWEEFLQERFFRPLEMTRTSTSAPVVDTSADVASPHVQRWFGFGRPAAATYEDLRLIAPAGAMHTSVNDMLSWMRMNLSGGLYEGTPILSEGALRELWKPQIPLDCDPVEGACFPSYIRGVAGSESYGLGWFIMNYRGHRLIMHSGGITGQRSVVGLLPDQGLGIVVLSNMGDTEAPLQVLFSSLDRFMGVESRHSRAHF
jgi:CubicO group peptidase (beta-lactamase class C family)